MNRTEMGFKEKLFLLSIDQENGRLKSQNNFYLVILYASVWELMRKKLIVIHEKNWQISQKPTNDPVLDEVQSILAKSDGKKPQWQTLNISTKSQKLFKLQVEWMVRNKWIEASRTSFLGIPTGYRFRILKPEILRKDLTALERVLIYGRKPSPEAWMMIQFLGIPRILRSFFRSSESKQRVNTRFSELNKTPPFEVPTEFVLIIKKFKEAIESSKTASAD
ncbi:MAG TPA: hypothetical protein DCM62_04025 [Bacteroidales bacterium]|nr:hypothetical protein [Bacteroidales bacterium]